MGGKPICTRTEYAANVAFAPAAVRRTVRAVRTRYIELFFVYVKLASHYTCTSFWPEQNTKHRRHSKRCAANWLYATYGTTTFTDLDRLRGPSTWTGECIGSYYCVFYYYHLYHCILTWPLALPTLLATIGSHYDHLDRLYTFSDTSVCPTGTMIPPKKR